MGEKRSKVLKWENTWDLTDNTYPKHESPIVRPIVVVLLKPPIFLRALLAHLVIPKIK